MIPKPLGALILAAGIGSRMGNRPKPLLQLNGESLIVRLVKAIHKNGIACPTVVLGHHHVPISNALQGLPHRVVHADPRRLHQQDSLRAGLEHLRGHIGALLICLGDQPLIGEHEIHALLRAYLMRPPGARCVVPWVGEAPGNPVVLDAQAIEQILEKPAPYGGKDWQNENPALVHRWMTVDESYRLDVDTPEDLVMMARRGSPLRWPEQA
ncbi:MAG: nucleotidyltransferase family protein [Betaproteobacteria bacterium]|nr:nucleotidyltransferase family protein [Betaproteobacteria bacterium]NBY13488.1 nucleotidyltransferase family protein [Betaproteobacteria bacterium]NDF03965.1 nucleotidyltransferase family protein [Betaproteobacteria bacterium]